MQRTNLHATVAVLDGRGVLISGPSGSGKSSLALHLIDLFRQRGRFAMLVADDRVWASVRSGRLVAEAPEPIAGLIEIRGFGPAPVLFEPRAIVDLAVTLVEPAAAPRLAEDVRQDILGVALPLLKLAARDTPLAALAVAASLRR